MLNSHVEHICQALERHVKSHPDVGRKGKNSWLKVNKQLMKEVFSVISPFPDLMTNVQSCRIWPTMKIHTDFSHFSAAAVPRVANFLLILATLAAPHRDLLLQLLFIYYKATHVSLLSYHRRNYFLAKINSRRVIPWRFFHEFAITHSCISLILYSVYYDLFSGRQTLYYTEIKTNIVTVAKKYVTPNFLIVFLE